MSNRLSDRYPCRGVLNTPLARLSSPPTPFAGRLVGRMQYAPTLPAEKSDLKGWQGIAFGTSGDEYVFHFSMFNRLSDGYPGRGILHTPPAHLLSTISPFAGRLVGRMQYAPTFPEKDKVSLGMCFLLSRTMADKSVFHFSISNRLSDRGPCRGVLHTPHNHSRKGYSIACQTIVGRMQYAPTFPEKDKVYSGRCFPLSRTMADKSVFHSSMSNRLLDRFPGRGAKAYAPCAFIVYPHALAGRLVRRMQYAPTLPAEKSNLKGWRGITFRRRGDSLIRRTKKGRIFWREDRRREI